MGKTTQKVQQQKGDRAGAQANTFFPCITGVEWINLVVVAIGVLAAVAASGVTAAEAAVAAGDGMIFEWRVGGA